MVDCVTVEVDFTPPPPTTGAPATSGTTGVGSTTGVAVGPTGSTGSTGASTGVVLSSTGSTGAGNNTTTTGAPPPQTTGADVSASASDTALRTQAIQPWAIVIVGLSFLGCVVAVAWGWTWVMKKRKKKAIAFARGHSLHRVSANYPLDNSSDELEMGDVLDSDPELRYTVQISDDDEESASSGEVSASASEASELRNVVLHDIAIGAELGKGAFGAVFLGLWDNVEVACKKLNDDPASAAGASASYDEDFLTEARRLNMLDHPNIVRFYGLFQSRDDTYIVMEYLSLGSLDQYLITRGRVDMNNERMLGLCIGVANGMKYLARKGVVHGDLGARNVLVSRDDRAYAVKIADFGLSLLCDRGAPTEDEQYVRIPKDLARKFPVRHSAPEVIDREQKRYSTKSDVWSMGVLVWEIYSYGEIPYGGRKNENIVKFIRAGGRLKCPDGCTDQVYDIMLKCWNRRPERRPSFRAILDFLSGLRLEEVVYNTVDDVRDSAISTATYRDPTVAFYMT